MTVTVHRVTSLPDSDVTVTADGVRCTTATRTLVDLAAPMFWHATRTAVAHAVQQRIVTVEELRMHLDERRGHPHTARLRELLETVERGARSGDEVVLADALAAAGAPGRPNGAILLADGRVRRGDVVYDEERLALQLESRAFHQLPEDLEADMQRDTDVLTAGYATMRIPTRRVRRHLYLVVNQVLDELARRRRARRRAV